MGKVLETFSLSPTPLFFIATSKFLAARRKTLAWLPLWWHFSKLVQCNEESPRCEEFGGPHCKVQRAHGPDKEHSADLPLLPGITTNSLPVTASVPGAGTNITNSRSQTCFTAMQITTHCQRQPAKPKQQMVEHLHCSFAGAHLCFVFPGQVKWMENPHLTKKLLWALHLNLLPSSASSQIPVDRGLLSHLFILLSHVTFSPSTSPTSFQHNSRNISKSSMLSAYPF